MKLDTMGMSRALRGGDFQPFLIWPFLYRRVSVQPVLQRHQLWRFSRNGASCSLEFKLENGDVDGFSISPKAGDPEREAVAELALRDGELKSEKSPLIRGQLVLLPARRKPLHAGLVRLGEHDRLVNLWR